ncbi:hypothetical protein [Caballeronia terrestris]|jgi:hypothetical protein|nr:hypothetical protein [Caballeronia terrestris]
MKKTIATYWPIAILVPIALAAYMHAMGAAEPAAAPREMTTAATVSAELARAVSFGYVEPDGDWMPATPMPHEAPSARVL